MKKNQRNEISIRTKTEFLAQLEQADSLKNCTISPMDLTGISWPWESICLENVTFLGCEFEAEVQQKLNLGGAVLYIKQPHLPYHPFRASLYTWQELESKHPDDKKTVDEVIYHHFSSSKYNPHLNEALNQRIHDHAMDDALREVLQFDETGMTQKKCVGIMGGHSTLRTDPFFRTTALTAQLLAKNGYYVVSGGGPGIMEAANLGAYFGTYEQGELEDALKILAQKADYRMEGYQDQAREVLSKYPHGADNLAIPTWFYGHEPSNYFAKNIAKYFSNSLREDILLAICLYGVVFAPGSAGTTQEIFQDAAQNHYGTFGFYSPMVFLGKERFSRQTMLYPLLQQLAAGRIYQEFLHLTDQPEEVLSFLLNHPPRRVEN
ncbi:MAG: hypothetical protein AAF587_16750 [Bacteroidota bacterium]